GQDDDLGVDVDDLLVGQLPGAASASLAGPLVEADLGPCGDPRGRIRDDGVAHAHLARRDPPARLAPAHPEEPPDDPVERAGELGGYRPCFLSKSQGVAGALAPLPARSEPPRALA